MIERNVIPLNNLSGVGTPLVEDSCLYILVRNFAVSTLTSLPVRLRAKALFWSLNDQKLKQMPLIMPLQHSDGTEEQFVIPMFTGLLLSCQVYLDETTLLRHGDCYISINLIAKRPDIPTNDMFCTLAHGYLSNSNGVAYPSFGQQPVDGHGKNEIITLTNPAAGSDPAAYVVPNNRRFLLRGITWEFTDVAGGGATPLVFIEDTTTAHGFHFYSANTIVGANHYNLSQFGSDAVATIATVQYIKTTMPQIYLHAGDKIIFAMTGIGAGDTWVAVKLWVQSWVDVGTAAGGSGGGGGIK